MNDVFNLPNGITTAADSFASYMFYNCSGNAFTIGDAFNLPGGITTAESYFVRSMFQNCGGGAFTMNEVFNLPQNVTNVDIYFAAFMFQNCNGNHFIVNNVFQFPVLTQTQLDQSGIFDSALRGLGSTSSQTRTAASIINGNPLPGSNKNTFTGSAGFANWNYIPTQWGGGGWLPPTITTTNLPNGTYGTAYSQTLIATGGTPITWSTLSGNLPDGLTLNNASGVISGMPSYAVGTFNFTVRATNDGGNETKAFSIVIDKADQTAPAVPTVASKDSASITLNTISGAEYRLDTGAWQDSPVFAGLSPNTGYTFYARLKETVTHYASPESPALAEATNRATGAAVSAPTVASKTATSVILNAVTAPANGQPVEYAVSTSNTAPAGGWQDDLTFNGLFPNTEYFFFACAKENGSYETGVASAGTAIRTAESTSPPPTPNDRSILQMIFDFILKLVQMILGFFAAVFGIA